MRAVIWTDVFQCIAMLGGLLTIMIKVCWAAVKNDRRQIVKHFNCCIVLILETLQYLILTPEISV